MPRLSKPPSLKLTKRQEVLLREVHRRYDKIILEKEFGGGFSGTRVFLVLPTKVDGTSDARVVTKIGPAEALRRERDNYEKYVAGALPFSVAHVQDFCEENGQAALNYIFAGGETLGKTVDLEEYYHTHTAQEIIDTLTGLLDKALGERWYGASKSLNCPFREEYGRHLPAQAKLQDITQTIFPDLLFMEGDQVQIPDISGTYPNPLQLFPRILDKTLEGRSSLVHGDLHWRNVLVDESGKGWLIDFAKVETRHNLFDFIKLETYLRLMVLPKESSAFSLNEYAEFERALHETALGRKTNVPTNGSLAKAYDVIRTIRQIAQLSMRDPRNFKTEYLPALFLYSLAMMKYFPSNGTVPTQLVFITACVAGMYILHDASSIIKFQPSFSNGTGLPKRSDSFAPPSNILKPRHGSAPPPPSFLVGRGEALRELKSRLGIAAIGEYGAARLQVLTAIRGWPGIGKTTIAAAIANDTEVAQAFPDGVLWISLGPAPSILSEIAMWGRALGTEDLLKARTIQEASHQLAALLRNKQMLLVVDDVWEVEHAKPFLVGGTRCATLLTTRENKLAQDLAPTPNDVYILKVLTEEKSLELLRLLAPSVVDSYPQESIELVNTLEGLPLALQVAGHLLNTEQSYGFGVKNLLAELREGTKILESKAPGSRIGLENETSATVVVLLQKSTDRLDAQTRDCYAYLGAFAPKPATFDEAAMKAVWEVEDPRPAIKALVDRGLLEYISEMSRYQMHALLVSHAKSLLIDD